VSFQGRRRLFGNAALDAANTNLRNTLLQVLDASAGPADFQPSPFECCNVIADSSADQVRFEVTYNLGDESTAILTASQVLALAWKDILRRVMQHVGERDGTVVLVAALPDTAPARVACMQQALQLAMQSQDTHRPVQVSYVARGETAAACYQYRYKLGPAPEPKTEEKTEETQEESAEAAAVEEPNKHVSIVGILDMGHGWTSLTLLECSDEHSRMLGTSTVPIGCRQVDELLFALVASELASKHKLTIDARSKAGSRLLKACSKARKVLSANMVTDIVLESFGEDGKDYVFHRGAVLGLGSKDYHRHRGWACAMWRHA
jgi:molecular chaperone DnaK (HSP70)